MAVDIFFMMKSSLKNVLDAGIIWVQLASKPTETSCLRSEDFIMQNISTAILLPLIQEEQLSLNGERMYVKY